MLGACSTDEVERSNPSGEVPEWIRDGVELARSERARADASSSNGSAAEPGDSGETTSGSGSSSGTAALPPRDTVIAALRATGMGESQAGCVFDALVADPAVAADAATLFSGLAQAQGTPTTVAAPGTLAGLSPESSTRLLGAVGTCLDPATLTALLAGTSGATASGSGALQALLNGLDPSQLAALQNLDPSAIVAAVGGGLSSAQRQQLESLLEAARTLQTDAESAIAGLGSLDGLQLSKLDLTKLDREQAPLLIAAVLAGLTPEQRRQLNSLSTVDLASLDFNLDPSTMTSEEVGRWLLVLSPVLAATISPTGAKPPPGADPSQIYIPPGTDLSQINPLVFLNRNDAIAAIVKEGFAPATASCLVDRYVAFSPATVAAFFSTTPNDIASAEILLATLSCIFPT